MTITRRTFATSACALGLALSLAGGALAQDVYTYFANALTAEAGITLNQPAIDAVHTSFR